MNMPNIQVESGGVKLGWSTLITAAAICFAVYVASLITPLETAAEANAVQIAGVKEVAEGTKAGLITHLQEDTRVNARLEASLNILNHKLETLNKRLDELKR